MLSVRLFGIYLLFHYLILTYSREKPQYCKSNVYIDHKIMKVGFSTTKNIKKPEIELEKIVINTYILKLVKLFLYNPGQDSNTGS